MGRAGRQPRARRAPQGPELRLRGRCALGSGAFSGQRGVLAHGSGFVPHLIRQTRRTRRRDVRSRVVVRTPRGAAVPRGGRAPPRRDAGGAPAVASPPNRGAGSGVTAASEVALAHRAGAWMGAGLSRFGLPDSSLVCSAPLRAPGADLRGSAAARLWLTGQSSPKGQCCWQGGRPWPLTLCELVGTSPPALGSHWRLCLCGDPTHTPVNPSFQRESFLPWFCG